MLQWHYVSQFYFDAIKDHVDDDNLFFIADSQTIMRGKDEFIQSVIIYDGKRPANKITGRLYINRNTLEGIIWNGKAWKRVIDPVTLPVFTTEATTSSIKDAYNGACEKGYINLTVRVDLIEKVRYNPTDETINIYYYDDTIVTIPMTGVTMDMAFNKDTSVLSVIGLFAHDVATNNWYNLTRYISDSSFDMENEAFQFTFEGSKTYMSFKICGLNKNIEENFDSDDTDICITITGDVFTAEALAYANLDGHNVIGYYDTATGPVNVIMTNNPETIAYGKGLLTKSPNARLMSVSSAANMNAAGAMVDFYTQVYEDKMDKVGEGHKGEVLIIDEYGNAKASGYRLGTEVLGYDPKVLATEAAVFTYVGNTFVKLKDIVKEGELAKTVPDASDEKIVSEKAFVSALSFKRL